jgi:hypothetical protein
MGNCWDVRICMREIIKDRCIKASNLAPRIGLTAGQLSAILTLRRKIEVSEFFAFCDFVQMTADEVRGYLQRSAKLELFVIDGCSTDKGLPK